MSLDLAHLNFPHFFNGSWIGESQGQDIEIENGRCSFVKSKNCPLSRENSVISLMLQDRVYLVLSASQNTVSWSDGDVWVRKSEVERRMAAISLKKLQGSWKVKGEDVFIDIDETGTVKFNRGNSKQAWIMKKTRKGFEIKIKNTTYNILITSCNGMRLCWKQLGVWTRNKSEDEVKESTLNIVAIYRKFPSHIYHEVSLPSLQWNMTIRDLKDVFVRVIKKNLQQDIPISEIHIAHMGISILEENMTLVAAGLSSISNLVVTVLSNSRPASPSVKFTYGEGSHSRVRKESDQGSTDLSTLWFNTQDFDSSALGSEIGDYWAQNRHRPNLSFSNVQSDVNIYESDAKSDDEESSEYEDSSFIEAKEFESLQTSNTSRTGANLYRRKTLTNWSDRQLNEMENEMKDMVSFLQQGQPFGSDDLWSIELNVLDGDWIGKANQKIKIDSSKGVVDFRLTKGCPFYKDLRSKKIIVQYKNQSFHITKVPRSMNEILWSDGDVWVKKPDDSLKPIEVAISELQGRWFRGANKDEPCEIRGSVVNFQKTKGCPLVKDDDGIYILYRNKRYTVDQISNDKKRIFWADRDIWYRDRKLDEDSKSNPPQSFSIPPTNVATRSRVKSFGSTLRRSSVDFWNQVASSRFSVKRGRHPTE